MLKRDCKQVFASSRLSETSSPERDNSSLKTEARRLSESLRKNQGELMLFSPRRDMLAWAKIPALAIVHACNNQTFVTKQRFNTFQATTTTNKPYKHETKSKQAEYCKNMQTLTSLTWKKRIVT